MSESLIRAAFETRLNGMLPALATAFENVPYTPVTGTPYQQVFLLAAEPENPSVGAALERAIGIFQVTLFYPINAGPSPAWARGQAIKERFPRGLSMTSGAVTVHVTSTPSVARGESSADRYSVIVRARYKADIFN